MREIRMDKWCDLCWMDNEERTLADHSFAIGVVESMTRGPLVRLLEACDVHAKPFIELAEVTAKLPQWVPEKAGSAALRPPVSAAVVGVRAVPEEETGPPSSWMQECKICQLKVRGTSGLITHIYSRHVNGPRPTQPPVCPDCGERFTAGPPMASHRRSEHGFDSVEFAYSQVYNQPRQLALG